MTADDAAFASIHDARETYRWCLREMAHLRRRGGDSPCRCAEVKYISRALSQRAQVAYRWLRRRGVTVERPQDIVYYAGWRR